MNSGNGARVERGVVSLTYDGTLPSHAHRVLPALQRVGLTATFYADPALMLDSLPTWQAAVKTGHEVGNGCLLAAALPDGSLPAWTPEMIADDAGEADSLLREVFPEQADFSFAFPWGPDRCADGRPYHRAVEKSHAVCRSGAVGVNPIDSPPLNRLRCIPIVGLDAEQALDYVDLAAAKQVWVILAIEGVGEGERGISEDVHDGLLDSLSTRQGLVQVAPVSVAAGWLAAPGCSHAQLM